jgi:N-acetylglucosamine-6-phosphate deacetylase
MNRFIDLQIAGYGGVDFLGDSIDMTQLRRAARRLEGDGVAAAMLTLVTDDVPAIVTRISRLRSLIDADSSLREMFPAFHVEGPCLSPKEGYRGAHPEEKLRPATPSLYEPIIEAAGGWDRVGIITLAPECDPGLRTTRWLAEHGVTVSLGHTDAPVELLREAVSAGARLFTHLGNGCAKLIDRHDNIINRALSVDGLSFTVIADGHHVPFFVLGSWIRWVGAERIVFISDAVAPAAAPPGRYRVGWMDLQVGADGVVRCPGTPYLAGSALTMPVAHQNAMDHLGLTPAQADAVCRDNPARLIRNVLKSPSLKGST